jgi:uncharacterized protein (DUF433 family)
MTDAADSLVGVGLYTVPEASRLARIPAARLRRWVRGYSYRVDNEIRHSSPVWRQQLPAIDKLTMLGFLDLVEARFVNAFLDYGVSLHVVRLASARARELFQKDHPFSTKRFKTDGRAIFAEITETGEAKGELKLLDLVRSQFAFHAVVSPSLYAGLDFSDDDRVLRWYPMPRTKAIVVDPQRAFGRPITAREGVPTEVLANAARIERSVTRAARWYDVPVSAVRAAIAFEDALKA